MGPAAQSYAPNRVRRDEELIKHTTVLGAIGVDGPEESAHSTLAEHRDVDMRRSLEVGRKVVEIDSRGIVTEAETDPFWEVCGGEGVSW